MKIAGLNSLSFLAAVKKLKRLEGFRLRKISSSGKKFVFEFSTKPKTFLVSSPGHIYLTREKPVGLKATGFVSLLRKHLEGRAISQVTQMGGDRIVTLDSGNLSLILEVFDGNIILTDRGKIVGAAVQRKWRTRSILPGHDYKPPPLSPSLESLRLDSFQKLFGAKECVKLLAADLGLGKTLSEHFLALCAIPKDTLHLERSEADKLLAHIFEAIERLDEDRGYRYGTEVFPLRLDEEPDEVYPTFFQAVEASKSRQDQSAAFFLDAKRIEEKVAPLEQALARQKAARQQLLADADAEKEKANKISENLQMIDAITDLFRKTGWSTVISHPSVLEARPEAGKIKLKL